VSIARRPEVAVALPPEKRLGRWLLLRADSPFDASVHARHLKDTMACGGTELHVRELGNGTIVSSRPPPAPWRS